MLIIIGTIVFLAVVLAVFLVYVAKKPTLNDRVDNVVRKIKTRDIL